MRIRILNQIEAEQYASMQFEDFDDYTFTAWVDAEHDDPGTTYELVNRCTELRVGGIGDIAEAFDENQFSLDVVKQEYVQELSDLLSLVEVLEGRGIEYSVVVRAEVPGRSPADAIETLASRDLYPFVNTHLGILRYQPGESPVFQTENPHSELQDLIESLQ